MAADVAAIEGQRPVPRPDRLSQPFWDATIDKRFLLQQCSTCGRYWWIPELACPHCRTETLNWVPASGRGEVYSYVVMHHSLTPGLAAPYVVAVVTLAEGPRFLTNIVDIAPNDVEIGMPVEIRFGPAEPYRLPVFAPSR